MINKKIIIVPFVVLLVLLGATALGMYVFAGKKLPFIDKVITMPVLEKSDYIVLEGMYDAMKEVDSFEHNANFNLNVKVELDLEMSSRLNETKIVSFFVDKPIVLGIDNERDLGISELGDASSAMMGLPGFGPGLMDVTYKLKSSGKTDMKDKENIKNETKINLNFDMGGMEIKVEADLIVNDQKTYFKIGQMPFPLSIFLGGYTNKWFVLDSEEAKEFQKELAEQEGDDSSFGSSFDQEKIEEIQKEINNLIKKHKLVYVKERLPDELINEKKCYNYLLDFEQENLNEFAQDIVNLVNKELNDVNPQILHGFEEGKKFNEAVEKIIKALSKKEMQVWIDKESFYLRKMNYDIGFDLSDAVIFDIPLPYKTFELNIYGDVVYNSFGQDFDIKEPEGAENILKSVSDQLFKARTKARDARRLSDIKQIQTGLEIYYNDLGRYPETINPGQSLEANGSMIIKEIPLNPLPNDEDCAEDTEYRYQVYKNGQSYELSYCLGLNTGSVSAGNNIASPLGVTGGSHSLNDFVGADDIDGDGLNNNEEQRYGTKVDSKDSDSDGLYDFEEIFIYNTDPLNKDSDADGYNDGDEVRGWYDPMSNDVIEKDYSSPERTIRQLDFELRNNKSADLYSSKYHRSDSFKLFIKDELGLSLEEFDELSKLLLVSNIGEDKIKFQNFIKLEKFDEEHILLAYETHYETANDYVTISDKDESYLVLVDGEWLLDIETEFKNMKKNDPFEWEMVKMIYLE